MSDRLAIPVLAFHAIEGGTGPLRIPPATFSRVVEALVEAGSTAITSRQAGLILDGVEACPTRPVVFTFDDGYRSVHEAAFPILRSAGWVGTIFPVTSGIGGRNTWDAEQGRPLDLVSGADLVELSSAGWEVGGHSHRHRSLPSLEAVELEDDLRRADDALEELLGFAPDSFAYPYGHHDQRSRSIAAQRYRWCWTIGAQRAVPADPRDALPRIEAWYVQRAELARHLHDPVGSLWLGARRVGRALRSITT